MRALITGGGGQLAAEFIAVLGDEVAAAPTRAELDIADAGAVRRALNDLRPDVVINTAAFHQVDICESEPEASFAVNAAAPQRLAAACNATGSLLVHFSTDYVFDGTRRQPYRESDPVAPISVYGASKAAGEMAIRATMPRHLIIRTTGLYGLAGRSTPRGNFVETMLRLAAAGKPIQVVAGQTLTPSYTPDVAASVLHLVERGAVGTYHVTNSGECSWYQFAVEIFRLSRLELQIEPTTQDQRPTPARRPVYSVLDHAGLRALGLPEPRPWQEALSDYLRAREATGVAAGEAVAR